MEIYSYDIDFRYGDEMSNFIENGHNFAEQMDEFECCLRPLVGDIIGHLAHAYFHPTEENKHFRNLLTEIISSYVKFEINDYDWKEDVLIKNVFKSYQS